MGLDAAGWGVIATGAGTVVSLAAAGFAYWQARIARDARDATIDQAKTAREALELQRAQQHQADAPTFALTIEPPDDEHGRWVKITMISGPPGISVAISYVNGWLRRIGPGEFEKQEIPGDSTHRRQLIKNASAVFRHDAPVDAVAIWSLMIINSTEVAGQDRTWEYVERIDWPVTDEESLRKARLVTIDVTYPEHDDGREYVVPWVEITNHSEQPVHRPRIESIVGALPPVRFGPGKTAYIEYSLPEILPASANHRVPFEHFNADDERIDTTITPCKIEKWVDVDNVTFTFTDLSGVRWERTGNRQPVRVGG